VHEVMRYVKVLTRIDDPYEILKEKTPQGRFIMKRYNEINQKYADLLKHALKQKPKDGMIIYTYPDDKMSFTKELANEIFYHNPKQFILIAREKNSGMKISMRSPKPVLPQILAKALIGLDGYGGGHEHACGAVVNKEDFDKFVRDLKEEIRRS